MLQFVQLDLASLSPKGRQVPTVWLFKKIYVPTTWVIQVHTHTHTLYSPLIHPHGPNLDFLPVNSHIYHSETLKSPFKHFYYHNAIHHMDIEKYSDHNTLSQRLIVCFSPRIFPVARLHCDDENCVGACLENHFWSEILMQLIWNSDPFFPFFLSFCFGDSIIR